MPETPEEIETDEVEIDEPELTDDDDAFELSTRLGEERWEQRDLGGPTIGD